MVADRKTKIIDQIQLTKDVYYIKLNRTGDFVPGQLLALSDSSDGDIRYYSIASGIDEDFWGILYNVVDDGWLTPWLSGLKKDQYIYTSSALGNFLPVKGSMVWIATGTGIAPFYSMVLSGLAEKVILIHGAREKKDFFFYDTFLKSLKSAYIPCSSLKIDGSFYPGRLSRYLQDEFSFTESTYFLCGSSSMVVDIRDILLSKGVDFNKIVSEIYF